MLPTDQAWAVWLRQSLHSARSGWVSRDPAVSPAENVINLNLKDQTDALLKTLTPREERVIEIGEAVRVTRANVGLFQRAYALTLFPWVGVGAWYVLQLRRAR